jgi:palmitoyltransferase ZDHHC9/14/18
MTAVKDPATIHSRKFLYKCFQNDLDVRSQFEHKKYLAVMNGFLLKMKYCQTCDIYRPPRAIHCGDCECCIERLDHHCPWVGTCIGKRNQKYFLSMVWSVNIQVLYSLIFLSEHIFLVNKQNYMQPSVIVSIFLFVIIILIGILVSLLNGYHMYLLVRNETTNENLKKSYKTYGNPFQKGLVDNFRRIFSRNKRNWKPELII